jgi:N-acetylneuraminate synthase/sialic acid synthase
MRELTIAGCTITDESDAFVIAEIGHNHQGNVQLAKRMIMAAKQAGCDAVKLQKRSNKSIFTKALYNKSYNSEHAYGDTYGEHREALEFEWPEYNALKKYAQALDILFFATAFDEESADFLDALGVPAYKIASGDLRNVTLIKHIANKKKPVILSTGGATATDIWRADFELRRYDIQAAFLHCVAIYPTPAHKCNLSAIRALRDEMSDRVIGYSCHYNGIVMAEMAYMYGARIIEKHFTLDHTMKGSDHALSLQPDGMRRMVRDLRRIRQARGSGEKIRAEEEEAALAKMEKCVYPTRTLPAGHILQSEDFALKTPATPGGLEAWEVEELIGKELVSEVSTAAPFTKKEFEDV